MTDNYQMNRGRLSKNAVQTTIALSHRRWCKEKERSAAVPYDGMKISAKKNINCRRDPCRRTGKRDLDLDELAIRRVAS